MNNRGAHGSVHRGYSLWALIQYLQCVIWLMCDPEARQMTPQSCYMQL